MERTLFYGRPLLDRGTGQVQSLLSYIEHLALAHNLTPVGLLKTLYGASTDKDQPAFSALLKEKLHNGGSNAQELMHRLKQANGQSLADSTLQGFRTLFGPTNLTRRSELAYCPGCLQECGGLPYMRLLWTVRCVSACHLHRVRLRCVARGASCGKPEERLPLQMRPHIGGVCATCGSVGYRCFDGKSEKASDAECWIASQVSSLIALPQGERTSLTQDGFRQGLREMLNTVFDGSVVRAARAAGLSKGQVCIWQKGERPSLPSLLQLCLHSKAELLPLLRGKFELAGIDDAGGMRRVVARKYVRRPFDADEVKGQFAAAMLEAEPPSLKALASRLNITVDALRDQFPDSVKRLRQHRTTYLQKLRLERFESVVERYSLAALTLTARGGAAHKRTIQSESGLAAVGRGGYRVSALKQVLHSLRPSTT